MKQNTYSDSFIPIIELNKADKINIVIITFSWAIAVVLVNPIGDFPLNDDWAYAQSVKSLLETGSFQLPGWAVANLLPQALWGVLIFPLAIIGINIKLKTVKSHLSKNLTISFLLFIITTISIWLVLKNIAMQLEEILLLIGA